MKTPLFRPSIRGFTLVELLVVIGIIAILSGLGFGAYTSAISRAHTTKCLSNMRSLASATLLYVADNDNTFPDADAPTVWDVSLLPYLGGNVDNALDVLRCPSDKRPLVVNQGSHSFARSYTISGITDVCGVSGSTNIGAPSRRVVQLNSPSPVILFAEWFAAANYQYNGGYSYITDGVDLSVFTGGVYSHGSQMNFAFTDGHCESLTPTAAQPLWQAVR